MGNERDSKKSPFPDNSFSWYPMGFVFDVHFIYFFVLNCNSIDFPFPFRNNYVVRSVIRCGH